MDTSQENATKDKATPPSTKKDIGAMDSQQTSTAILANSNKETGIQAVLADPAYSGFGTWLGTLISVVAAIVAFKQAKAAISAVERVKKEQQRKYVENAHRAIANLDQVLNPIVFAGIPARGQKVPDIVKNANAICHQLLSSPVENALPCIPDSIREIEINLARIAAAIQDAKGTPPLLDPLQDIQASIRNHMQLMLRKCMEYLDQNATDKH